MPYEELNDRLTSDTAHGGDLLTGGDLEDEEEVEGFSPLQQAREVARQLRLATERYNKALELAGYYASPVYAYLLQIKSTGSVRP